MADLELNSIGNGDGNNYLLRDNTKIPLSGSNQISGSLIPSTNETVNLGSSTNNYNTVYTRNINHGLSSSSLILSGGNEVSNGSNLVLYGTNRSDGFQGRFDLTAKGSSDYKLTGLSSGNLVWSGNAIVPSTDNGCNLGSTDFQFNTIYVSNVVNHNAGIELSLSNANDGADIALCPKEYYGGFFRIRACNGTTRHILQGEAHGILYWSGTVIRPYGDGGTTLGTGTYRFGQIYSTNSAISTSDERQKDNIKQIDDKLLQAWGNVNIVQFNFKDALEKKGENARLHTGYIAQNIQQACEENGVNPNDYGLFCHDSWEEQEEKKDENGQVIEPYRAKGDLYSLRYEEALIVECAYLRRENNKLKQQMLQYAESLSKLEERLKALEQSSK